MYEFIYCWAMNGEVRWSSENADTLLRKLIKKLETLIALKVYSIVNII